MFLPDLQMSRWAYSTSPNCDECLKSASAVEHRSLPDSCWNMVLSCGSLYRCSVQRSHFWTSPQLQSNGSETGGGETRRDEGFIFPLHGFDFLKAGNMSTRRARGVSVTVSVCLWRSHRGFGIELRPVKSCFYSEDWKDKTGFYHFSLKKDNIS